MSRLASILFLLIAVGCTPAPPPLPTTPTPTALEADGLHNLFRVSDRVFSGSSPYGEVGFKSLQQLGVKTVLSVDGAKPEVEAAERHGMRYVHLPIGYDGIPSDRAALLAKAVRDLPGPIYVHCHHGKHRGPAACVVIQLSLDPSWTPERAAQWLTTAGTDPKYSGLVALPRTFHKPTTNELDSIVSDFPMTAHVADLVRLMVDMDARWEHLKEAKSAGWKSPASHPDLDPLHEAVMLTELYREATRLKEATAKGKEFVTLLGEAETAARDLEKALRANDTTTAGMLFTRSQSACTKCHEKYRDRK